MSKITVRKWESAGFDVVPCLAMCKCTKAGVITLQSNVASVTRLSLGHWRVVFSTPMPTSDYSVHVAATCAVGFAQVGGIQLYNPDSGSGGTFEAPTVNGFVFGIVTSNGAAWADPDFINFTVHGRIP